MYTPDKNTFAEMSRQGFTVPVLRELPADLETPISVFVKLKDQHPSFLLESVERGEHVGRYSFIGIAPFLTVRTFPHEGLVCRNGDVTRVPLGGYGHGLDPLHLVQQQLGQYRVARTAQLPRFYGGAVGFISYDVVHFFEKLADCWEDRLQLPDSVFLFTDMLVVFDHLQHKMKVVCNVRPGSMSYEQAVQRIESVIAALASPLPPESFPSGHPEREPARLVSNFTPEQYAANVEKAKEYIFAGDAFQVVPSQRLSRRTWADSFTIYRALRMVNPSPYMFYLDFDDFKLLGSSPELLVKVEDGRAEVRPIAGTRPRGKDEAEDVALQCELLADPKERAEHVMLVDLGRNDLGRVCTAGSVHVPLLMSIERYSHVMHIVSSVQGKLAEGQDAFSLFRACFPAGTVTGAPKIRAMDIITELEGIRRGPYAGAVGYFGFGGNMDTCIAIRTLVMKGDTVYLQAGGGVVADSDPASEYQESLNKVKALETAIRLAENWEG